MPTPRFMRLAGKIQHYRLRHEEFFPARHILLRPSGAPAIVRKVDSRHGEVRRNVSPCPEQTAA